MDYFLLHNLIAPYYMIHLMDMNCNLTFLFPLLNNSHIDKINIVLYIYFVNEHNKK